MTDKTPHPHAELIAQLLTDIYADVEVAHNGTWLPSTFGAVGADYPGRDRFRLAKHKENKIVSSLTDEELINLYSHNRGYGENLRLISDAAAQRAIEKPYEYASELCTLLVNKYYPENKDWRPFDDLMGVLTQIDNTVCGIPSIFSKRVIEDLKVPPIKWFEENWPKSHFSIASCAIEDYITDLKEGKL
jgi:hypothetical protein